METNLWNEIVCEFEEWVNDAMAYNCHQRKIGGYSFDEQMSMMFFEHQSNYYLLKVEINLEQLGINFRAQSSRINTPRASLFTTSSTSRASKNALFLEVQPTRDTTGFMKTCEPSNITISLIIFKVILAKKSMSPTWALGAAGAHAATATMKKLILMRAAKWERAFGEDPVIIGMQRIATV